MKSLENEYELNNKSISCLSFNTLITMKELEEILRMSRSQIDKLCRIDSNFPKKISFGESRQSMVRFCYIDVMNYIEKKKSNMENDFYHDRNKIRFS